ncbi:MAG: T9SS type A sorting domain-containing protein [Bacteroidia bacterium]
MKKYTFIALFLLAGLPLLTIGQGSLKLAVLGNDAKCNGSTNGSAIVTPSGGVAPYTYTWAPAGGSDSTATGLAPGTYTVTVTDNNGNNATTTITINQPAPLLVSIDTIVVKPCFTPEGGACGCNNTLWAIVNGGTPPYSYFWTPDSAYTDTITGVCYEEFTVKVSDQNSCITADSIDILIPSSNPTGIDELSNNSDIKLYPVPATDRLNISSGQWSVVSGQSLEVYDMMGKLVLTQNLNGHSTLTSLDVSGLANGNYLLRIAGTDWQKIARFSVSR